MQVKHNGVERTFCPGSFLSRPFVVDTPPGGSADVAVRAADGWVVECPRRVPGVVDCCRSDLMRVMANFHFG